MVFRGASYEKGADERDIDFSNSSYGYSTIDTYEIDYHPDNNPENELQTKRCDFQREILLSYVKRFKAYGVSVEYAEFYLDGSYSDNQTTGSAIYSTPETWVDSLVRWDTRPQQRTEIKEIDGGILDTLGQRIIVDVKDYIGNQLTSPNTEHRFIIAPSQSNSHLFSLSLAPFPEPRRAYVPEIKFRLRNNSPMPADDILQLGYVDAGDIIQLNTKFFPQSYLFSGRGIDEVTGKEVYPTEYRQSIPINPFFDKELSLNADIIFEPVNSSDKVALNVHMGTAKNELKGDSIAVSPGDSVYATLEFEFPNGVTRKPEPFQILLAEVFDGFEFGNLAAVTPDTFLVTTIDSLATDSAVVKTRFVADIGSGLIVGKANPEAEITELECFGSYPKDLVGIYFGCGSITIKPLSGIYALANPDTIAPSEVANLTLQRITAQADTVDFPSNQLFQVSLSDSSAQYGDLISADNADTADVLTDALKGFRFLADSTVADSVEVIVEIKTFFEGIELMGEATINARPSFTIEVVEEFDLEDQLWSYLPDQTNGLSRGDNLPSYNSVDRTFSVQVLRGNSPVPNVEVEFYSEFVAGTGGHDHENVDELNENLQGTFFLNGQNINRLKIRTNENGIARVDSFRTSQFSGEYIIKVRLVTDTTVFYQKELEVRVPNLVDFSE